MTQPVIPFRKLREIMLSAVVAGVTVLAGCANSGDAANPRANAKTGKMGERVSIGNVTYTILEAEYKTQLGTVASPRIPKERFLVLRLAITNGGAKEVELPMFTLVDADGKEYPEEQNAEDVAGWFGMIRRLGPTSTEEGRIVFDARPRDYKLEVTDGGETGAEKIALIEIPMQFDTAEPIPAAGQASPKP